MRANLWISVVAGVICLAIGFVLVGFSGSVRDYYFRAFKQGAERTGVMPEKINSYPGPWFFKVFGWIVIAFGVAIAISIWRRLS